VGSSYSSLGSERPHSANGGKKKQSVSDRLYLQSTQASRGRADADLNSSSRSTTKKSPPQLKQSLYLMPSSGGTKPKITSQRQVSKTTPFKATGLGSSCLEHSRDYNRSREMHDMDLGTSSSRRTRGNSPRR